MKPVSFIAIDPGSEESALVELDDDAGPMFRCKRPNDDILKMIEHARVRTGTWAPPVHLAIEMIASYGMPVGREVFETCLWIGRFVQAWNAPYTLVYRRDVKMFLCANNTAKDGNIRRALIDRFGGKERAIGKKKTPGPLYGFRDDLWAALGVGVTWRETYAKAMSMPPFAEDPMEAFGGGGAA